MRFGVAILISPGVHFEPSQAVLPVVKHLKEGGIFICDNYHGTSNYVNKNLQGIFERVPLEDSEELVAFRKRVES